MKSGRIEFISAYCDRWCERCAFTEQCSIYAVRVATPMCDGNFEQALELALGRPRSPTGNEKPQPPWRQEALDALPTQAELDEQSWLEDARLEREPLATTASAVMHLSLAWLESHRDLLSSSATGELASAAEVLSWDASLIAAKIHRALDGRDRWSHGEQPGDSPIQNDWNGSAKVALISTARSAAACGVLAAAGDSDAARLADELRNLGHQITQAFPNA